MLPAVFRYTKHLRQAEHWDRATSRASRQELLRALVEHARRAVPLYAELYSGVELRAGGDLEWFRRLPIVTKEHVQAAFPDRIVAGGYARSDLLPIATSGTTDRVMLFHDGRKRDWDRAADLALALDGDHFRPGQQRIVIPPDACYERCGADGQGHIGTVGQRLRELLRGRPPGRRAALRELVRQGVRQYVRGEVFLPAFGVDGTATPAPKLDEYLEEIRRRQPTVLHALPMFLHMLAERLHERDEAVYVPILRPAGGKATPAMIERIEAAFLGRVRENYGTAELGTLGHDCPRTRAQHLFSALYVAEFLRGGRPVAPGELGEIVVTDLRNRAAPLIRYATGDVGTYERERCPCGRTGLLFTVHGRLTETVVTPNGRAIRPDELLDFGLRQPGVRYARLVQQNAGNFRLEYVPAAKGRLPAEEELSAELSELLDGPVAVQARAIRRIMPERSGKYTLAHSNSWAFFHETERVPAKAELLKEAR